MAHLGFKTPRWQDKDDMEDGRTAEELRTEIRAFKTALAQEEENASVAGSISTTDEHNIFQDAN